MKLVESHTNVFLKLLQVISILQSCAVMKFSTAMLISKV